MDVTKLFDAKDNIAPLDDAKLDMMIEKALAHPQLRVPANQNTPWFKRAMAVAAALVIAITVSLNMMPTSSSHYDASDAYDEISDLVLYETFYDLS